MPPKYTSESEDISDNAESSDNFQVVPSADSNDEEQERNIRRQVSNDEEDEEDLIPNLSDVASEKSHVQVEEEEAAAPTAPPHPMVAFLFKTLKTLLLPFCKIFFAPAAQKTFVKTTVMIFTISCIIVTSMFAYIVFYNQYVPPITHVQPIWFQYGLAPSPTNAATLQNLVLGPKATVNIAGGNSVPLRHEQVYDVSVQFHVPTSDTNFDIGNFMIDLQLQTSNGSAITTSSRAAILRYQSRTQRIMRVFAKALPLLIGLTEESQVITVRLIDNFIELKSQAVNRVEVSISDPRIQIYDAKLLILAKFHGLRYYMYFHRIMTAIVFMFIFATIEFICATIAWKGFGEILWHKLYQLFIDHEQPALQQQEVAAITNEKDEEELSSNGEQSASATASERSN